MVDLEIGVAEGGSPWSYSNKSGILAQGNSSLDSGLTVIVDPSNPYFYLPQSSCNSIAEQLPVAYEPGYGLYFWNTSSPQYEEIITSPSYLGFHFSKNGLNNEYLTIKVPFALLNLTMEAPLVRNPVQYFPCMATNSTPALGRAFLQAAFIGVNWFGPEEWYLAQAPGPGESFIPNPVAIRDDESISGSSSSWEETWKNKWVVIPTKSPSVNVSADDTSGVSDSANKGIPRAVQIGIIAGISIGLLLIIATSLGLYLRRRAKRRMKTDQKGPLKPDTWNPPAYQFTISEVPDTMAKRLYELNNDLERYEMDSKGNYLYEIGF